MKKNKKSIGIFLIAAIGVIFLFILLLFNDRFTNIIVSKVTNISNNSATITWVSEMPVASGVLVNDSDNFPLLAFGQENIYRDDRTASANDALYTHSVTVANLDPEKTYFFRIVAGIRLIRPETYSFATVSAQDSISYPRAIYGKIRNYFSDGNNPVDGIVYYKLRDDYDSTNSSATYSTVINGNSNWSADIKDVRTAGGMKYNFKLSTAPMFYAEVYTEMGSNSLFQPYSDGLAEIPDIVVNIPANQVIDNPVGGNNVALVEPNLQAVGAATSASAAIPNSLNPNVLGQISERLFGNPSTKGAVKGAFVSCSASCGCTGSGCSFGDRGTEKAKWCGCCQNNCGGNKSACENAIQSEEGTSLANWCGGTSPTVTNPPTATNPPAVTTTPKVTSAPSGNVCSSSQCKEGTGYNFGDRTADKSRWCTCCLNNCGGYKSTCNSAVLNEQGQDLNAYCSGVPVVTTTPTTTTAPSSGIPSRVTWGMAVGSSCKWNPGWSRVCSSSQDGLEWAAECKSCRISPTNDATEVKCDSNYAGKVTRSYSQSNSACKASSTGTKVTPTPTIIVNPASGYVDATVVIKDIIFKEKNFADFDHGNFKFSIGYPMVSMVGGQKNVSGKSINKPFLEATCYSNGECKTGPITLEHYYFDNNNFNTKYFSIVLRSDYDSQPDCKQSMNVMLTNDGGKIKLTSAGEIIDARDWDCPVNAPPIATPNTTNPNAGFAGTVTLNLRNVSIGPSHLYNYNTQNYYLQVEYSYQSEDPDAKGVYVVRGKSVGFKLKDKCPDGNATSCNIDNLAINDFFFKKSDGYDNIVVSIFNSNSGDGGSCTQSSQFTVPYPVYPANKVIEFNNLNLQSWGCLDPQKNIITADLVVRNIKVNLGNRGIVNTNDRYELVFYYSKSIKNSKDDYIGNKGFPLKDLCTVTTGNCVIPEVNLGTAVFREKNAENKVNIVLLNHDTGISACGLQQSYNLSYNHDTNQIELAGADLSSWKCNEAVSDNQKVQVPVNGTVKGLSTAEKVLGAATESGKINKGRYTFQDSSGQVEVIVKDDKTQVQFYADTNQNSVKDPGEQEIDNPGMTSKVTKVNELEAEQMTAGWNLVNFSSELVGIPDSGKLLENLEQTGLLIDEIASFENNTWHTYVLKNNGIFQDEYGNPFTIKPKQGYFLKSRRSGNFYLLGQLITKSNPDLDLKPGWNLAAFDSTILDTNKLTAISILTKCKDAGIECESISFLNNGLYNTVVYKNQLFYGSDYTIQPEKAYLIKVKGKGGVLKF